MRDLRKELVRKLQTLNPKYVNLGLDIKDELKRIVDDGQIFSKEALIFKILTANQCHRNAANKYYNYPDLYSICTGYALSDDEWLQHSWLLNKQNQIVETINNDFQLYYGYILTPDEADDFMFYNY